MQWRGGRESGNVEDRRGMGAPIAVGGGIIGVIALLFNLLTGSNVDPSQLPLPGGGGQTSSQPASPQEQAEQDELAGFAKVTLGYTEDVWRTLLPEQTGTPYRDPTLVLFSGSVQSACGGASAASGPFYCPGDQKLYVDLSFYQELRNRLGGGGDFAMAYVIAHEVGHHIQTLMGTSQQVSRLRGRVSEAEYNRASVKLELQADFLAGVWAHHIQKAGKLETGDVEEAMNTAAAIGDDRLTQGRASPESFTHGTSEQRMYWFNKGLKTGDVRQGDTFNSPEL